MTALRAHNFWQQLTWEIVANNWIFSWFCILPPLVRLNVSIITIYWRVFFERSAFSSWYFGVLTLLSYKLSNSSNAVKNYWASCWAYPENLCFFTDTAIFSYAGCYTLALGCRIRCSSFKYAWATLAPWVISFGAKTWKTSLKLGRLSMHCKRAFLCKNNWVHVASISEVVQAN